MSKAIVVEKNVEYRNRNALYAPIKRVFDAMEIGESMLVDTRYIDGFSNTPTYSAIQRLAGSMKNYARSRGFDAGYHAEGFKVRIWKLAGERVPAAD